jgi:hypothetical protein
VTRQCVGCGSALPPERRSPHCEGCWPEYQRQRNREKVWAYRNRARQAIVNQPAAQESRPPNEDEFGWLEAVGLGLYGPVRGAQNLLDSGRDITDPEVRQLAWEALQQFDAYRDEFEAEVGPETEQIAASWRGYFESIRRLFQ